MTTPDLPADQVDEDADRFVWDDQEIEVEEDDGDNRPARTV